MIIDKDKHIRQNLNVLTGVTKIVTVFCLLRYRIT